MSNESRIKVTREMQLAGLNAWLATEKAELGGMEFVAEIYRAMLAAAPATKRPLRADELTDEMLQEAMHEAYDLMSGGWDIRKAYGVLIGYSAPPTEPSEVERLAVRDDLHLYGQGESYTFDELVELCRKDDEAREMRRLAAEIADQFAIGQMKKYLWVVSSNLKEWYKTPLGLSVQLTKCVAYLELRGLLEHHPDHPEWVRVRGEKP